MIATIAEKKKVQPSQRSYENHFPAIAETTIAEIELFFISVQRSLRSRESGFLMIAIIAAIAELFFLSDRSDHSDRSDRIWKPGLSYSSLLNKIRFNNYNT